MNIHSTKIVYERPEVRVTEIESQGVFLGLSDKIVVEVDEWTSEDGGVIDFDE